MEPTHTYPPKCIHLSHTQNFFCCSISKIQPRLIQLFTYMKMIIILRLPNVQMRNYWIYFTLVIDDVSMQIVKVSFVNFA